MNVYSYSYARQNLADLLDQAYQKGEVEIKRRDGRVFIIKPERKKKHSPLDVKTVDLGITTNEIIKFIHEGRKTK